ncbi:MAG: zinc ribbon domain-containing protein [Promethearchaeota archaeon]|jgi:hypothetical protein
MREIYDYAWAFPLVGAILGTVAMLTPAAYIMEFGSSFYLWIWGLVSFQIFDPYLGSYGMTIYTDNLLLIIPSVIISIIIMISIIVLIGSANRCRKDMKSGIFGNSKGLTPSILIIISTIAWIVSVEFVYMSGGMHFWTVTSPGFGVIGMFLGSSISIIGYAVSKRGPTQRGEVEFIPKKDIIAQSVSTSIPVGNTLNFCPECGQNLAKFPQRFCMNCGFEFKKISSGNGNQISK